MIFNETDNKPKEECGLFGIYDKHGYNCARMTYYALYSLQHRGQESCGMAVNNDNNIFCHKDLGLVQDVFNDFVLSQINGNIAIGHVRYSTTGSNSRENAQPLVSKYVKGTLTIAHNGNLTNAAEIRENLEQQGAIFQTTNDSEVIAYVIARERLTSASIEEAVSRTIPKLKGAFSLLVMSPKKLIALRDPYGIRPLCMGKLEDETYVFSSESCAFDTIGAKFIRDIKPGEIVVVDSDGLRSREEHCSDKSAFCIFEHIYFARPDSVIDGQSVYEARKEAGRMLARQYPIDADMVIGVPDSGLCAAIGYAEESGIPYGEGLIKNRYIGRTFIQPSQTMREKSVSIKLNVLKTSVAGKRIIMVDDSIVRGTTTKKLINMLKDAGASEVHVRISAPPFLWPCFFGTDISDRSQLIACHYTVDQICNNIGADSLGYIALEGLSNIAKNSKLKFCDACFSGNYPFEVPLSVDKLAFEKGGKD